MEGEFCPGLLLRAFQHVSLPHKLGLGERLWARSLGRVGTTWVDFGSLRWKTEPRQRHSSLARIRWQYEEPGVRRLLEKILDARSVIIDAGANIGQMILMYLRQAAPAAIHAFEPTPEARAWLEENIAANNLSNIHVSPLGLGNVAGSAHLHANFSRQEGARNFITRETGGMPIEMTTLDGYATRHGIGRTFRFWKLDVEGFELPAPARRAFTSATRRDRLSLCRNCRGRGGHRRRAFRIGLCRGSLRPESHSRARRDRQSIQQRLHLAARRTRRVRSRLEWRSRPMRVTIVQGPFLPVPPLSGGAVEKIWFALGKEFVRLGHTVTQISRHFPGLANVETIEGVRHIRVGSFNTSAIVARCWN